LHPNNFYLIEAGLRSIDLDDNVDKRRTGVYSVYYTEKVTHRAKPPVSGFYIPLNDLVFLVIIFSLSR